MLLRIHAGTVEVVAEATVRANTLPRPLRTPPGGLYPMRSAAFEMDEYRMMAGWPVPVPRYDIHADSMVSGDGSVLGNRETPTSVLTGATYRWVADSSYYNIDTLRWDPIQGGEPAWVMDPVHAPTLIDNYEYQVDDERFEMTAINFDSDTADYLSADLTKVLSTDVGYTVIMVMSPNSVYGNDADVPFNGLWGSPVSAGQISLDIVLKNNALWVELTDKPSQKGIAMAQATRISAPSYLALVIKRPRMRMYLGQGPSDILSLGLDIGPPSQPLSGDILLGKYPADDLHNADLALFDLGLYGNPLTIDEIRTEFALLSQIYGGD